mmetsp:Transcript_230/g.468  ORF Transcript_230/g.468 Transcript_230/m.468 type:complete len:156 (-) Transcript_230:920-1387(-)|eukprot:CAMPEP_0196664358 /NCGR_PEP_ID=MMETSP1086-20130531/56828_1 /TAXON_ID=77921 /ORGANISM="Cyanoptyche  gloeocystis , Strain SAG4.97" /LENGTH=155 /DNA_ID=CAMNT_0042000631 /DNA_START=76 /DNA_END=543 /DNA_ORIENTATION=+
MADTPVMVALESANKELFHVEKDVICMSNTIKDVIEEMTDSTAPIPVPNVSSAILQKIIEYCRYHTNAGKGISEEDRKAWDKEFVKVEQGPLFELILAANYLNIKQLLDLTCSTVADMIRGKTPEEIRRQFNIKNDFTPEEEEEVRKENAWCEER